jgi:hypothetical protein
MQIGELSIFCLMRANLLASGSSPLKTFISSSGLFSALNMSAMRFASSSRSHLTGIPRVKA